MDSRVGERLAQKTDDKIVQVIYADNLKTEFPQTFPHIIAINRAHVIGLVEKDVIDHEVATSLLKALDEMETTGVENINVDPELEESYFNHEAWIINRVGIHTGGRMHIGRSRNDLGATADRLKARQMLIVALKTMLAFRQALVNAAGQHAEVVMPGYTHMQPAQPMSFGYYLAAIASAASRDHARLQAALDRLDESPLGAAALTGTTFPLDSSRTAALLGFSTAFDNGLDAVASRDFVIEASAAAAMAATTCSRMAQDFHLMVTDEFSTLLISDSVSGTSSIMPQKKNPFLLEYVRGMGNQIVGAAFTSSSALAGKNYTVAIDAIREDLRGAWSAITMVEKCLSLSELIVQSVTPNTNLMLKRASENFATVTDLADLLVAKADLSFREAHHIVGHIVRLCLERRLRTSGINAEMVSEASLHVIGREIRLDDATIVASLDPRRTIASRKYPGGTAPEALRLSLAEMQSLLTADHQKLDELCLRIDRADASLREATRAFTG